MKKITGESDSSSVIVIDPSGKRFETTAENAAHLPEVGNVAKSKFDMSLLKPG